jgi:hypothetical protein
MLNTPLSAVWVDTYIHRYTYTHTCLPAVTFSTLSSMKHEDAWKSFAIIFSYFVLDTLLKYRKVLSFVDRFTAVLGDQ